ncbi:hypothetical protein [[Clostridium] dakarense]|uniref:hypothetical protein n=1 Tax=Faecalimicrobium dakarense TaxID=1301100 RepID=UPI0005A9651A|nr:hypothetical protein [[Clostridium] dakarense]
MIENKFIYTCVNIIVGMLNIMIVMTLVISFGFVILALCLVNGALFLTVIFGVLKIFIPSLPVNVGINNIILDFIIVCVAAIMSYYLYKFLSLYVPQYLSFLSIYMKKSFAFKFNI